MSVLASFVVRARFDTAAQAARVARYLPEAGRVALAEDVAEADRDGYRLIEQLDYAWVEQLDPSSLLSSFDFSGTEDFDVEAVRVLAALAALGGSETVAVLEADEEARVYVRGREGVAYLLVMNAARQQQLRRAQAEEILDAAGEVLAGEVGRWSGTRWDVPDAPAEPLLVPLEGDDVDPQ